MLGLQEFTTVYPYFQRMRSVIQEYEAVTTQLSMAETQAAKLQKLKDTESMPMILELLQNLREQVVVMNQLARDYFSCNAEELREKFLRSQAVLNKTLELIESGSATEEAKKILESAGNTEVYQSEINELAVELYNIEQTIEATIKRIKELIPEAFTEEVAHE
jgi:hypothetical protein